MFTKLRNLIRFGVAFFIVAVLAVILMDQVVMPLYVSQGKTITLQDVRNLSFSRAKGKLNEMELKQLFWIQSTRLIYRHTL